MRDVGSEMLQLFKRLAQAGEQSVEHARHVPKLVVRIIDWDSLVQSHSCNLLGQPRHLFQWVQSLAGDAVAAESSHDQGNRQGKQQQSNELDETFRQGLSAVGESDKKRSALEEVKVADRENLSPIVETHSSRLVTCLSF